MENAFAYKSQHAICYMCIFMHKSLALLGTLYAWRASFNESDYLFVRMHISHFVSAGLCVYIYTFN